MLKCLLLLLLALVAASVPQARAGLFGEPDALWPAPTARSHTPLVANDPVSRLGVGGYLNMTGDSNPEGTFKALFHSASAQFIANPRFTDSLRGFVVYHFAYDTPILNPDRGLRSYNSAATSADLELLWAEYDLAERHTIRAGHLLSPFGELNRVHFPGAYLAAVTPYVLNGQDVYRGTVNGLELHGLLSDELVYHAYMGSTEIDRSPFMEGVRLSYGLPEKRAWQVGASFQRGNKGPFGPKFNAFGGDGRATYGEAEVRVEVARNSRYQFAWFFEPSYGLGERWRAFYRYEGAEADVRESGDSDKTRHSLGADYLVGGDLHRRLKLEVGRILYRTQIDGDGKTKNFTQITAQIALGF